MQQPSLRRLESDLEVNKTTLHNWKRSRPKLFEFIIESYKDKELLKQNLRLMQEQKRILEGEISLTTQRVRVI
jgi:hypothetical protein